MLSRDDMVDGDHGSWSGIGRFPDRSTQALAFGPPWSPVGFSKQTGQTGGQLLYLIVILGYYSSPVESEEGFE